MSLISASAVVIIAAVFVASAEGRVMGLPGLHNSVAEGNEVAFGKPPGKRRMFDPSCKGIYDRELFGALERVCESCYNLYRQAHVATECR